MVVRFGLVGIDTSHVVAFTQRLNHLEIAADQWVDGGQVVAVLPFPSRHSPERVAGFTQQLRDYGLTFCDRPEDLIGQVDGILVEENDGTVHLERAMPFLEAGLPVFVDKPLASNTADARALVAAAHRRQAPLLSASSLRYDLSVQEVQSRRGEWGAVLGVDSHTPASQHPLNPGWMNYGIHGVEIVYALLGPGCRRVRSVRQEGVDVAVGEWADGRIATVRGIRTGRAAIGLTAFMEKKIASLENSAYAYRELLKQIVGMCQSRRSPVAGEELVEVIAFQEAANRSMEQDGAPIDVAV